MSAGTRRGFLRGAAAGALAPLLVRTAPAEAAGLQRAGTGQLPATMPAARRVVTRRGRAIAVAPHGDRVVVAHDARRTVAILGPRGASRIVDVGGQPLDVAVSPDGRTAAVTTASWDHPGLSFVDLRSGVVAERIDVGAAPFSVAFTGDGRQVLVTGGEQEGTVHVVDVRRRRVVAKAPVGIAPRGLALGAAGAPAWVALNGEDRVVGVDQRTGRVIKALPPSLRSPDRLALAADGRRLLVSHGGRSVDHVSQVDLDSGRSRRRTVGPQPCDVAWTRRGRPLVALGGDARLVRLDARSARRIAVTGAPRGLAVAGGRAWVVDGLSDRVARVRV